MTYAFRHRLVLGPGDRLPFEVTRLRLLPASRWEAFLEALDPRTQIREASDLCIRGRGFPQEEDAEAAAYAARAQLERTFALLGVAADFGDRRGGGAWSAAAAEVVYEAAGARLHYDKHGLIILLEEPDVPPLFSRMTAKGSATQPAPMFERALAHPDAVRPTSDRERLAFDLLSSASFVGLADARFMMLMMSLEVLIEQAPRSDIEREHIDSLLEMTREAECLSQSARETFVSALNGLRRESVGAAGRRLIADLGQRRYDGKTPQQFFKLCYRVRSDLVHGNLPRPTREEVDRLAANLEPFVGHLLAGPKLVEDVLGPVPGRRTGSE